jgi:peroxiredoxin
MTRMPNLGLSGLFWVSYAAMWVLLVAEGVLLLLVFRHFGMMAMGTYQGVQRDGLEVGEETPDISAVTSDGGDVNWAPGPERPTLLVFAAADCGPCADAFPYLSLLARQSSDLSVVAVTSGPRETAMRLAEKFEPPFPCLADDGSGAWDRYRVRVTPFGFVIGTDRRVRSKGLLSDWARIHEVLTAAGLDEPAGLVEAAARKRRERTVEVLR